MCSPHAAPQGCWHLIGNRVCLRVGRSQREGWKLSEACSADICVTARPLALWKVPSRFWLTMGKPLILKFFPETVHRQLSHPQLEAGVNGAFSFPLTLAEASRIQGGRRWESSCFLQQRSHFVLFCLKEMIVGFHSLRGQQKLTWGVSSEREVRNLTGCRSHQGHQQPVGRDRVSPGLCSQSPCPSSTPKSLCTPAEREHLFQPHPEITSSGPVGTRWPSCVVTCHALISLSPNSHPGRLCPFCR